MEKVVCVGSNVPGRTPVLFLKPPSVVLQGQHVDAPLPLRDGELQHECEVVLRLDARGTITGVTLGLDMTLRELWRAQKAAGAPWTTSKVFAGSALLGPWHPAERLEEWAALPYEFRYDGTLRQRAHLADFPLSPRAAVAFASQFFQWRDGDALFLGSPPGFGPVIADGVGEASWGSLRFTTRWVKT